MLSAAAVDTCELALAKPVLEARHRGRPDGEPADAAIGTERPLRNGDRGRDQLDRRRV